MTDFETHPIGTAERIEALETRLELWPVNPKTGEFIKEIKLSESCDGIACRDATIELQDERIAKMEALIAADGKEIGSYRETTGLRGEIEQAWKRIENFENAMRSIQAATSDKAVLDITDKALCDA